MCPTPTTKELGSRLRQTAAVETIRHHLSRPADDDAFNYPSLPPSVSSMSHQDSPATPQTSCEDPDNGSRSRARGEDRNFPVDSGWMITYTIRSQTLPTHRRTPCSWGYPSPSHGISVPNLTIETMRIDLSIYNAYSLFTIE